MTYESRGTLISTERPPHGGVYRIMIVSVRWPSASPVPRAAFCASVRFSRESLPTSRIAVPGCCEGRPAAAGSQSTWGMEAKARTGTATV